MPPFNATPLTDSQRDLAREHVGLAFHLAGRLSRPGGCAERLGFDDALGVGLLAIVKAARHFDGDLGAAEDYFAKAIRSEVSRAAQAAGLAVQPPPFFEDLLAEPARPDPVETADEAARLLAMARRHLTAVEQLALTETVMLERSDKEVAEELGVHRSTISEARPRALRKLREMAGA